MSETPSGEKSPAAEKPPPKPSGIRPPSKIGRLCSSGAPKPAVPASPKTNDPNLDAMRKISDDYSRKYLADVQEADEEAEVPLESRNNVTPPKERKPSTCSTYSITSMEALWEKDPRKLSEAGLRRSSDHSIVLTEDTDGFIIGDRVYVGGSKPGQIAYIGDTQFAPGEWAGVVLEEPIGKNDGSVAGVRYFQCEPKKGVFSRLTRLTREQISLPSPSSPSSERGSSVVSERPPVTNGNIRAPPSPGSVTSIPRPRQQRSVSPNGSMRSVTSRMSTATQSGELRLGERVIVSSSQGSKAGTLRYLGTTEFANGQWCGVELDDPIGKNDGSVEGKRYFECAPRFGLFAPLAKVSRSPSNRRPGACAVHGRGSPPDSLASSMLSATGSVRPRLGVTALGAGSQRLSGPRAVSTPMSAKNTLQELLREKQQHIERLMVELETEKIELTKVCQKADHLQNILEATKLESAKNIDEIEKLKSERDIISRQLEDEKQKVEDLMFRAEEDNIHKEDFSKIKDELLDAKEKQSTVIVQLENELAKLKVQAEELQIQNDLMSSQHKAETEILIMQHKDEIKAAQVLSSDLQSLLDEAHALLKEKNAEKEIISKNNFEEISKVRIEFKTQLSESNNQVSELKSQLEEYQKLLDASKEAEVVYKKEIEKLKMDFSSANLDIENLIESTKKLENQIEMIQNELSDTREKLAQKDSELASVLENKSIDQNNILGEMQGLKEQLENKQKIIHQLSEEKNVLQSNLEKQIKENIDIVEQSKIEYSKLNSKLESYEKEMLEKLAVKDEQNIKSLSEKDAKLNELIKNMEEQTKVLHEEFEQQKTQLTTEINKHLTNFETISKQKDDLQNKFEEMSKKYFETNSSLSSLQMINDELQKELKEKNINCTELSQQKEKLEKEIADLTNNSSNSNEQLSILSNKLRETEGDYQNVKTEFRKKEESYQQQLDKLMQELDQQRKEIDEKVLVFDQQNKTFDHQKQTYDDQIQTLNNSISDMQENLNKNLSLLKEREDKFAAEKSELLKEIKASEDKISDLVQQNQLLKNNVEVSESAFNEMMSELLKAKENLENQLKESQNREKDLQNEIDLSKEKFDNANANLLSELKAKEEKETVLQSEFNNLQQTLNEMQINLTDKQNCIDELQKRQSELDLEHKKQIDVINDEIRKTIGEKQLLENNFNKLNEDIIVKEKTLAEQNCIFNELKKCIMLPFNPNISLEDCKTIELPLILETLNELINTKERNSKLETDLVTMNTEHLDEVVKLKAINENLEKNVTELQTQLKNNNEQLHTLQKQINVSQEEASKVITLTTEEKMKNEEELKKLLNDFENLKINSQMESKKLEEQVKHFELEIVNKNEEIAREVDLSKELRLKLETAESKTKSLEENIEQFTKFNLEEKNDKNKVSAQIEQLQKEYNEKREMMTAEICSLNDKIKMFVTENDRMKQEIIILNGKLNVFENNNIVPKKTSEPLVAPQQKESNVDTIRLLEEKQEVEGQVNFLNSVIVDMQKKNEELKARVEILEMGVSPNEVDDFHIKTKQKLVAPRMFCDICDIFDAHETEDCPRQTNEDIVDPRQGDKKKTPPAARPYCDICEIFGHATEDCDEEETY